ncbi:SRPBCC family protein [Sphingosinicella rhizophila]|uniref:SRPBCC family protein n=1 Tax=Sphingosinicella rhizophila TaxID=3050082 RepID=A0ABU3QC34_9SPHN|nr:SRPBCC family protein [Sphingosinicella sp. GR2756]MDT9600709.1 SRPBCC family protein [Sphingosinicella sp. GR2756]
MNFDVSRHANAVTRSVTNGEWNGKSARIVVAERDYATDIEDAWDALTSAERIPRWFLPVSGDLRLGGRYQLQGNAGGTIERCEPPRLLQATWEFAGGMSWVIVTLSAESEDSTRLRLEHIAHEDEQFLAFWDQFGPGAVGVGWDLTLLGFAGHVESGMVVDHKEAEKWLTSDNGKALVVQSSEGWAGASIAFGTEASAARQAADRTTAFYTGAGGAAGEASDQE